MPPTRRLAGSIRHRIRRRLVSASWRGAYTEESLRFTRDGDNRIKPDGRSGRSNTFESPAPMRFATASACWRRRRPCSAPAAPDASLEAVARRAGVGIGTLYRHFPTREALFEAVYRREVEQLSELAEQLKNEADPVDALATLAAIQCRVRRHQEGHDGGAGARRARLVGALRFFVRSPDQSGRRACCERAVAAGEIRADIGPEDVLRALVGMCYMHDQPGWQSTRAAAAGCVRRRPSRATAQPAARQRPPSRPGGAKKTIKRNR